MPNKILTRPEGGPPETVSDFANDYGAAGLSRPELMITTTAEAAIAAIASMPTLAPPPPAASSSIQGATAVTGTWRTGQKVVGIWCVDETRNTWILVEGLGWRKLFNGRDGAFGALSTLAAQARQTNRPISFREEADAMVYEIYVW